MIPCLFLSLLDAVFDKTTEAADWKVLGYIIIIITYNGTLYFVNSARLMTGIN
jgi:hypothetical protein